LNVRRIENRPTIIGVLITLTLAAVLGVVGPWFFRSTPASAAPAPTGITSVEAALGVAPSAVTLAAASNRAAVCLTTAATVSAKSAPALSVAGLPLVKLKGVAKPKPAAVKAVAKPAVKKAAAKPAARPRKVAPRKRPARKPARKPVARASASSSSGYTGPPPSGSGAERWRPVVRWYLKKYGVWDQFIEDKAIHIINGESSGNPNCRTGQYVGLLQFGSGWMSTADRLNPYMSICKFVQVYRDGGLAAIRRNWVTY